MPFTPEFLAALSALRALPREISGRLAARPGLGRLARNLAALAMACAHCVVLAALLGTLLVPYLGRKYVTVEASQALNREIRLKTLQFNPFTFAVHASDFAVMDKQGGGVLAGFSRLTVNLDPLALLGKRFKVQAFDLDNPVLHLARDKQGRLNIADLLPAPAPGEEVRPRSFELVPPGGRYSLTDIHIDDGEVSFDDDFAGTRQELKDLHFSIESLSSEQPGLHEIFSTGGQLNESGLTLTVKGDFLGENPEVEARLNAKDLVFRHYTPYLLPLKSPLDLKMDEAGVWVRMALRPGKSGRGGGLVEGNAKFSGVSLGGEERIAGCETLEIQGAGLDLSTGGLRLDRVEVASPYLKVVRDQAGIIDLVEMLEPVARDAGQATGQATGQGSGQPPGQVPGQGPGQAPGHAETEAGANTGRAVPGAPPVIRESTAPKVNVGEVLVKGGRLELDDRELGIAMTLDDLQARLAGLDTATGGFQDLSLEASGDRFKRLAVTAKGSYAPVRLSGGASMEGVDLSRPLPALKRLLPRLGLSGAAACQLTYDLDEKDGRLAARVDGEFAAKDLRALAEGQEKPLLAAGELSATGVQVDTAARKITVGQVSLSDGGAALTRDKSGGFPALLALPVDAGGASGASGEPAAPVSLSVARTSLSGFALEYQDEKAGAQARVDLEECVLRDFSPLADTPLGISAKGGIDQKASFEVEGQVRLRKPEFRLKLAVSGLRLAELARLSPPGIVSVLAGQAGLSGEVEGNFGQGGPSAKFKGDAGLTDLKLARPGAQDPFATASKLDLNGVSFNLAPLEFTVASLTLDQPWLGLALDKDGKPVLPFELAQASGPAGPPMRPPYGLGQVEVSGGRIDLTADGFEPPLAESISGIQASLIGQGPDQPVKVALGLTLGRSGAFKADGLAGWVGGGPRLDLKASLADMDLGELSPVCRKFTGFPIVKGKLDLAMDYKAGADSLDFKNTIVVKGIQLGPKTENPGGKDVPLDLAVSLLTNSKGVIDLDIPVRGDWSQAKADLGGVVSAAVSGAVARIFFAPLAFLKVARGSGRTAYVSFAPGRAELTPEARQTLAALGGALADRPRMSLTVMAYADPATEAEALAAALAVPSPPSPTAPGPAAAPAKPVQPTLADWTRLARQRQDAVLAFLAGPGRLAPDRLFPIAGPVLSPPAVQGQPGSRAEVGLRY